ncbi:sodium:proton antiporter [Mechercharimyces sp. CAU 1602]|uniref:cation:proton antiporter n=1 Tax=Mechercharimyces sp. CAU 1602 TaxID=2973933 RepID=UPI002162EDC3|nr:cation:proton antiporter [Mechercharimyces sp. CAU 1602]MCS1351828.1 cation:proton antiporter [Mechercharimyces sp. CAU 1602]
MENQFELILLLLAIAAAVTAIAKKLNVVYPIALVIVGTVIGILPIPALEELKDFVAEDEVFRFAVISIFLPALLGEATLKLPFSHLLENKLPILLLAVGGTLISYILIGMLSMEWIGLSVSVAFTFAALMAATDPVSVLSIFKGLGVDHRLSTIMEGESLVNDGLAVVLFAISSTSLMLYLDAGVMGLGMGLWKFIVMAVGGMAVGAIFAFLFSQLIRIYDDYPLEIIFSMILFYGVFFVAEHFHLSGVIAVVTAGLIFGNYGAKRGMTPTTKLNIRIFWDVLALLANSLVFLMVGLEINRIDVSAKWGMALLGIVIVLLARSVAVYTTIGGLKNMSWKWKHIVNWGGLRGSLSIALALSLPTDFAGREDLLVLSFSVVLFSLIIQGMTVGPLARLLQLKNTKEQETKYEEQIARIQRYLAGKKELALLRQQALISPLTYQELLTQYDERLEEVQESIRRLYESNPDLHEEQSKRAIRQALYAEHEAIQELEQHHTISVDVAEKQRKEVINLLEGREEGDTLPVSEKK